MFIWKDERNEKQLEKNNIEDWSIAMRVPKLKNVGRYPLKIHGHFKVRRFSTHFFFLLREAQNAQNSYNKISVLRSSVLLDASFLTNVSCLTSHRTTHKTSHMLVYVMMKQEHLQLQRRRRSHVLVGSCVISVVFVKKIITFKER